MIRDMMMLFAIVDEEDPPDWIAGPPWHVIVFLTMVGEETMVVGEFQYLIPALPISVIVLFVIVGEEEEHLIPQSFHVIVLLAIVGEEYRMHNPPPLYPALLSVIVLSAIVGAEEEPRYSPPP